LHIKWKPLHMLFQKPDKQTSPFYLVTDHLQSKMSISPKSKRRFTIHRLVINCRPLPEQQTCPVTREIFQTQALQEHVHPQEQHHSLLW
jgi:hypothetical protein